MQLPVLMATCCMSVKLLLLAEAGSCPDSWHLSGHSWECRQGAQLNPLLPAQIWQGLRDSASSTDFEDFASFLDSL